ncbi:MAG: non-homologous end-joining DNA ligase [Thermoproteota archaeon]|nr:non-homologous end-joining DNA ligase [Thermoproteota archaeon]
MALDEYNSKRNFGKTPEPNGVNTDTRKQVDKEMLRFVVQKHDASKLHYDFRLETTDGVLLSWAVPKGPSLDPKQKRLAVETEDHPLDYIDFEGVIPEDNYGAGTVIVWDTGTYTAERDIRQQHREGKISFTLSGRKLNGSFVLIKIKQRHKQWLLIKSDNDGFARSQRDLTLTAPESVLTGRTNDDLTEKKGKGKRAAAAAPEGRQRLMLLEKTFIEKQRNSRFPLSVKPMLAGQVDLPFDHKDWVFEVKWDGVRAILFQNKADRITELRSRNGNNITHRYPEITEAINSAVKCNESVVLDGEIVVLNSEGIPDFQMHQKRMNVDSQREIDFLSKDIPATYFVFDLLYVDGRSVEELQFLSRRQILDSLIVGGSKRIRISEYIEEKGKALFKSAIERKLEGIVAKHKQSKYHQAVRSPAWLKIKGILTQDCVVIGYTKGEGNRQHYFGSLILAAYNEEGKLRFIGHSGSGFGFDQLKETLTLMERFKTENNICPIDSVPYTNSRPIWLRPELVAEVKFSGWTQDVIMRAPIFVRFRYDKQSTECTIQQQAKEIDPAMSVNPIMQQPPPPSSSPSPSSSSPSASSSSLSPQDRFSNLDKVYWPIATKGILERQLTKRDLIEYYDKISKYILPHLRDRPLSLKRYPDGILGKSFYHKNWIQNTPDYVKTITVFSESRNDIINYLICNNKDTLLWLANLGCIEMHSWYSRVHDFGACRKAAASNRSSSSTLDELKCGLNIPDFIVFDLDPYIYSGKEQQGEEPEYNLKGFNVTVDVALDLKDLLHELNIEAYVKTSGKTGLHIFVPVEPIYEYSQTRKFAEIIGRMLDHRNPGKITMDWNTSARKGKVFFDYNQNSKGKTLASIFSLRPTSIASVSMPVEWRELTEIKPADFTLVDVPDILSKGHHAWSTIYQKKQNLLKMIEKATSSSSS